MCSLEPTPLGFSRISQPVGRERSQRGICIVMSDVWLDEQVLDVTAGVASPAPCWDHGSEEDEGYGVSIGKGWRLSGVRLSSNVTI